MNEDNLNSIKGTQCFECEGFRHIKYECPNLLKNKNKGISIIWFDSEDESERKIFNNAIAYSGKYEAESKSGNEDMTNKDLDAN